MGGTWIPTQPQLAPLLWRFPFAQEIQDALVSSNNMGRTITNSDLEQLALVCHPDVLTSHHDIREHTICALSDNTAAVSRDRRGSTLVNAPSAYLCRLTSIHQQAHRYRLNADYLPGPLNVMADDLSRRWDLSDSQILAYFNSNYPQTQSWRLCRLRPTLISTATKAFGCSIAIRPLSRLTNRSYHLWNIWSNFCLQHNLEPYITQGSDAIYSEYAMGGFPPPTILSELTQWQTPSIMLAQCIQWPTNVTLALYQDLRPSTLDSPASLTASGKKTLHHLGSCQSPYKSSSGPRPLPFCKTRLSPSERRT
jgi:hypothetical protein